MKKIDLNCDMGESFGAYRIGMDEEVITYITSANIACGWHAGDPSVMDKTVKMAVTNGVGVGAHPGYPDLIGFGRRNMDCTSEEIRNYVISQIGALQAFCTVHGTRLQHVKPHGALYLTAVVNEMGKARRIFIIALRSTNCLGVFMSSALKFLGRDSVLLKPGIGDMPEQMDDLCEKDLVIGFAFPRYTRTTVEVLREARNRGARVVVVTDGELSPLNQFAHHSLTAAYELDSHVESFTAALSLVNALVTALAFESRTDTLQTLNRMEEAWERQDIYWKG